MNQRPLSLTIIAWFLVITGLFGLYGVLTIGSNEAVLQMVEANGGSVRAQQVMGVVGCLVSAVCSYGIFKGLPWSRVLYVAFGIVSLIFNLLTGAALSMTILSAAFVALIAFFLFRPAANEWFQAIGMDLKRDDL
jgi:hypothetical protein